MPERVDLAGGVWQGASSGGSPSVVLRTVGDEDDGFLLDSEDMAPGARANALLTRCADDVDVSALTLGERDALLLQLRRLTFGELLDCVVRCPDCDETLELELDVGDLLVDQGEPTTTNHMVEVDGLGIEFRLPRVGDLEGLTGSSAEERAAELLELCVVSKALPSTAREAVAAAVAERDPQAELLLELTCPSCAARFEALFDPVAFLLQELDRRVNRLLREVHALAQHYHWSEPQILALSPRRRARYLDLISGGAGA